MGRNLYVENAAFEARNSDPQELLAQAGVCGSAVTMMKWGPGASSGVGFVGTDSNTDARKTIRPLGGIRLRRPDVV